MILSKYNIEVNMIEKGKLNVNLGRKAEGLILDKIVWLPYVKVYGP